MEEKMKRKLILLCLAIETSFVYAGGSQPSSSNTPEPVTIEFMQWWQPEMKKGSFEKLIEDFEAKNPNIKVKVITLPFAEVLNQITIGSASGTLSDVIGIEPNWLNDMIKQNMIEPFDAYITKDNYDLSQIASLLTLQGKKWIFPVTTFLYPMYYNADYFKAAGITSYPKNRSEFTAAVRKLTVPANNQYGWDIPLSLTAPNGIKNEVLSWGWAGGQLVWKDGVPNLQTDSMKSILEFIKNLYDQKLLVPGAFTKNDQEKMEDFSSGRTAMMVASMAHINLLRQRNPNLKYDIFPMPVPDGYTGKPGLSMASWAIGMARAGKNKAASWEFIKYLLDKDVNSFICSNANAFPGNKNSKPDFVSTDPLFAKAFEFYQRSDLVNEFQGQPNAIGLQRAFMEQFHAYLEGKISVDELLKNAQAAWMKEYQK
jgi:multiple sugar transport system substrate-binding protein